MFRAVSQIVRFGSQPSLPRVSAYRGPGMPGTKSSQQSTAACGAPRWRVARPLPMRCLVSLRARTFMHLPSTAVGRTCTHSHASAPKRCQRSTHRSTQHGFNTATYRESATQKSSPPVPPSWTNGIYARTANPPHPTETLLQTLWKHKQLSKHPTTVYIEETMGAVGQHTSSEEKDPCHDRSSSSTPARVR